MKMTRLTMTNKFDYTHRAFLDYMIYTIQTFLSFGLEMNCDFGRGACILETGLMTDV